MIKKSEFQEAFELIRLVRNVNSGKRIYVQCIQ